jgi:hypothetical protein
VDALAAAETAYLDARDAWDRHGIAVARGAPADELQRTARAALDRAADALGSVPVPDEPEDRRALATMRRWTADRRAGITEDDDGPLATAFAAATERLLVDGVPTPRLTILGRLAREPDPARRRALFLALEPAWRAVDGDAGPGSPYRAFMGEVAGRYARDGSPFDANAEALGLRPDEVEGWCVAILDAWREAAGDATQGIEPWDWWWLAGEAERRLATAIPVERLLDITRGYGRSLGAEPDALGIRFDVHPRDGRPPVTVAYTEFGARPRAQEDGTWSGGEPWVFASYTAGGLGELTELIHELGHAIHLAAIRTRPAFADWPDSDAFTEAIAEVVALDTAEPAWQERWIGASVPVREAIRGRYADVVLDAAWALFEIRLLADPTQRANDVWTAITAEWLRIAPHPEWSWWAIRGQLVTNPGYMANYALGAVLAADLRVGLRQVVGDSVGRGGRGNGRWYRQASRWLFRFGLERSSGDVIRALLGRPPDARALLAEIARMR